MSSSASVTLHCDEPGCLQWESNGWRTTREARREARRLGWSWSPRYGDRCVKHARELRDRRIIAERARKPPE